MADKAPWWRSFTGKRRTAARESAKEAMLAQQQQQQQQAQASPTQPADSPAHVTHTTGASTDPDTQLTANKRSNSVEDLEPTFNESSNRRNLRVSRSGRFKEKKRVRVSLTPGAEKELHGDNKASAKDDAGA